jgi:hypothetical protein
VIGDKVFDRFRARGGLPAPLICELDRALADIGAIGG